MARKFNKQNFTPQNPEKYTGEYPIVSRSSWEWDFMVYCDNHPDVVEWASEPVSIPYGDPITGKQKVYIPDFLVTFVTKSRNIVKKMIEIKPMHEQLSEHARNRNDAAIQARNRAKWGAAISWCQRRGIEFQVMNESNIYEGHDNRKGRINPVKEFAPAQSMPKNGAVKKAGAKRSTTRKSAKTPGQKVMANLKRMRSKPVGKVPKAGKAGKVKKA